MAVLSLRCRLGGQSATSMRLRQWPQHRLQKDNLSRQLIINLARTIPPSVMGSTSSHFDKNSWPNEVGTLQLSDLLGALSFALDATEGQPVGHSIRVTLIGCEIGQRLGIADTELHDLYYTLLLKDLGCSSNAARICELYLADDLKFKHAFKLVDGSTKSALDFLYRETARGGSPLRRAKTLISVIRNAGKIVDDLIETRCQQGAKIARQMGFSQRVALGIHALDEHWDGSGRPERLSGHSIPINARIALIAQVADVFMTNSCIDDAKAEIAGRRGSWFDPEIADVALSVLDDADIIAQLADPNTEAAIFSHHAAIQKKSLDDAQLDRIIEGFSQVIDAKSPFTNEHSRRVAAYTDTLADALGYSESERRWMCRSAQLHDIGKLGVPNSILDKPGKLDDVERAIIEAHTLTGNMILKRIGIFSRVAHLAEAHHERLDGKGYPNRLNADQLSLDVRILTVADIFDALSAERPYKPALPRDKVISIMDDMEGSMIDSRCYTALKQTILRQ